MKTIGIIGTGNIGKSFAKQATAAGYKVVLSNRRGPESLGEIAAELGENARAGTLAEAAAQPVVLYSAHWVHRQAVFGAIGAWDGRILIDASNHYLTHAPDFTKDDLGDATSSEIIAEMAPGARVVKAFNTILAGNIASGAKVGDGRRVLFLSGDNDDAKKEVAAIIDGIGFAPIDLGGLRDGGKTQQMAGPLAGINFVRLD